MTPRLSARTLLVFIIIMNCHIAWPAVARPLGSGPQVSVQHSSPHTPLQHVFRPDLRLRSPHRISRTEIPRRTITAAIRSTPNTVVGRQRQVAVPAHDMTPLFQMVGRHGRRAPAHRTFPAHHLYPAGDAPAPPGSIGIQVAPHAASDACTDGTEQCRLTRGLPISCRVTPLTLHPHIRDTHTWQSGDTALCRAWSRRHPLGHPGPVTTSVTLTHTGGSQ